MDNKNVTITKRQHQLTMIVFKWLPALMAFSFILNVFCAFFGTWFQIFTHYVGLTLAPLAFYYIASYVFHFCWYHRLFIHYLAIEELLNLTDWYFHIPISNKAICYVHFALMGIFLTIVIVTFIVKRPKKKGS